MRVEVDVIATPTFGRLAMTLKFLVHSFWFLVKYKGKDKERMWDIVDEIATTCFQHVSQ